ncbi:hypothetical protein ACF0H5_016689 [Mactra antiquata]
MNVVLIVANILCVLAFLLQVLCVALPHWFSVNNIYFGLWEYCASVSNDNYVCRLYSRGGITVEDYLAATSALEVLSLILLLVAMVVGILIFCFKYIMPLYIVAAILSLFAALSGLIGLIVFGVEYDEGNSMDGDNLHASFYLAVFATLFALIAGILFIVAKPKSAITSFETL